MNPSPLLLWSTGRKHGHQQLCFTPVPQFSGKVLIGPVQTNHLQQQGQGAGSHLFTVAASMVTLQMCVVAIRKVDTWGRHSKISSTLSQALSSWHGLLSKTLVFCSFLCKMPNILSPVRLLQNSGSAARGCLLLVFSDVCLAPLWQQAPGASPTECTEQTVVQVISHCFSAHCFSLVWALTATKALGKSTSQSFSFLNSKTPSFMKLQ